MSYKNQILKSLNDSGFLKIDLCYDRSAMQWVFTGEDTLTWDETGTGIYRIKDLTIKQWVETAEYLKDPFPIYFK